MSKAGPSVARASARKRRISRSTDLVGQRLAGHADVPVDLDDDLVAIDRGVGHHEVDRLLAGPPEGVQAGVHHQPAGSPRVAGQHPEPVEVAVVQAHLVRQPLGVQRPALDEGRVAPRQAAERGQVGALGGDGELQVVARDGLVERDRRGLGPPPPGGVVQVDVVLARAAAVGRRRRVVGGRRVGGQVVGHRGEHAGRLGQDAEPVAHGGGGGVEAGGGVGDDLVAVAVAQVGVVEQPPEDGRQVVGAELPPADLGELCGQRPGDLLHADGVQLVGGERQAGVHLDQRPVHLGAVVEVDEAGAVVGSGDGQQLVAQHVAVVGEGGADDVAHDVGELCPPGREPVPALGARQRGERVRVERRLEVALDLVDRALDVDAGGRAAGGEALAEPGGGLGQHRGVGPGAFDGHRRVLGFGGAELPGGDEQVGVDALHLVGRHLGQPQVDAPHGVVELVNQKVAGHGVGVIERRVECGGPLAQADPRRPQPLLGLGGQVVDAVVVAVVAEERGEQGAGLEARLPVPVGEGAQRGGGIVGVVDVGCSHGPTLHERSLAGERRYRRCRRRAEHERWRQALIKAGQLGLAVSTPSARGGVGHPPVVGDEGTKVAAKHPG